MLPSFSWKFHSAAGMGEGIVRRKVSYTSGGRWGARGAEEEPRIDVGLKRLWAEVIFLYIYSFPVY